MPKSPLAGLNVLLLEDDALLRRRLAGFLDAEKAEVTAVNTVAAARRALEDLPFEAAAPTCCATRPFPRPPP
jgi:CheY-like chemotaxis protein